LLDDKQLDNSPNFSLYTQKELEQQKYINEIELVIEKYNILENENQLIASTEKSYLYLINFILELHKNKKSLPNDLKNIFLNNIFLKEQINIFLEKKLKNLTKDDNIHFIKDINVLAYISTIGSDDNILNSYYNYDLEAISKVFRFYEEHLRTLFLENKVLFSLTFDSYIILLKTLIQLCTINSIDLIRKKSVNQIIDLMTETINIIKFTISLNDRELSKINNIQGKYLYYFSHLDEIPVEEDDLSKSFEKYLLCLEKQEDGFMLSKNNNFGYENDISEDAEFLIFKNYSSILLLKLLKKLRNIPNSPRFFDNPYFQKILRVYYKKFSIENEIKIAKNIEEFEKTLLSSLLYNYYSDLNFDKKLDYHWVIEDFILSDKDFDNRNLETIYRILFFISDIEDFKYSHITQILVNSKVIKNDYHEFFKLAIFDLFITKFKNSKFDNELNEILEKISKYILQNTFDFHLISICSKIFLNISLIYSTHEEKIEEAKKLYALFILLNDFDILEINYEKINAKILENLQFTKDYVRENFLDDFFILKDFELYQEIEIIKKRIEINSLSIDETINILVDFLTTKIFYGLCKIFISEVEQVDTFDYEFEKYVIKINHKYLIKLLYSKINEKIFNLILERYTKFIKDEFSIIFKSFDQKDIKFYLSDDDFELTY
jgi:hypothetical protein